MRRGMHPDGQDIFGEVDWMEGHRMEERPRNLVIRALGRHDITLHIDDGYMGGGEAIEHDSDISMSDFTDYSYGRGGSNGQMGFTTGLNAVAKGMGDRMGIFFYVLIAHDSTDNHFYSGQEGETRIWRTLILDNRISRGHTSDYWMWVFMHETGHIWLGNGIDGTHQSAGGGYEHCSNYDCAMYADENNYRGSYSNWNYCDECWEEIERGDFAESLLPP